MPDQAFELFETYAKERFGAPALDVTTGKPRERPFQATLETTAALLAWTQGARSRRSETFAFVPGFVDVLAPNAFADRWTGTYFLGMHVALYAAIGEFAMFCFAQRDFMPELGDAALERSPKPASERSPGLWLIDFVTQGGRVTDAHSAALTPRCDTRHSLATYLGLLMARFVWLHEMAHAFNGHVDFVRDRRLADILNEIEEPLGLAGLATVRRDDDARLDRQCLEHHADESAFWASMNIQRRNLENIAGIAELDERTRLRMTLFGCYAMPWLFENFQVYSGATENLTHPQPYSRLHHLIRIAASRLEPIIPDFADLNSDACGQFDAIGSAIPGLYRSSGLYTDMQNEALQADLDIVAVRLATIKQELQDYEYSHQTRA